MKNVAASVRTRLSNQARISGVTLDSLIERFAIGRLFWRLSQSEHSQQFILKGAQLFSLWADNPHRPTRDIDFLGHGDCSEESLKKLFSDLLCQPSEPEDGLLWGEIKAAPIREDQRYGGIRLTVNVSLAGAIAKVQIDVGIGDAVTPGATEHVWKDLLGFPEARLLTYPPETVIAEKLEAAVELDIHNSRMKDFYDLDWLSRHRTFEHALLKEAIVATFNRRGTPFPKDTPLAFTSTFSTDPTKVTQWKAFLRKNRLKVDSLDTVIERINQFLSPVLFTDTSALWTPQSGWDTPSSSS